VSGGRRGARGACANARAVAPRGETFEAGPGRLDAVVAAHLQIPRADVQRAIAAGHVTVDGRPRPKSHRLAGGERVEVDAAASTVLPPEGPPLEIAWRDEHLAVVRKPAGLPTHPTENRRGGTVVNRLLGMGVPLAPRGGPLRPGIVHRLDAGTSGLLVVASDDETHEALAAMFKRHEADRRYLALVRGAVPNDRFEVDAPLGRSGARVRVDATGGRSAATAFEVRERFGRATLLEAEPRTGRTHQIRVHLSAVGHPILGDRRYGGGGQDARALGLDRPFLHAWRIAFDHPVTGERIGLEDPLPEELERALERVRSEPEPA
jgi:23S rRNA pseudouridine1911/1915/1917 synthase